jgi:hypothetical protein
LDAPFFGLLVSLPVKLVSSNDRHLKSFLYPPHATLRLAHWRQLGFVSSHLSRLALHVVHPTQRAAVSYLSLHIIQQIRPEISYDPPLRLLDCFLLVTPLESEDLGAAFCGDCCGRCAGLETAEESRKSEGEGMVIVSAICCGGRGLEDAASSLRPEEQLPGVVAAVLCPAQAPVCAQAATTCGGATRE